MLAKNANPGPIYEMGTGTENFCSGSQGVSYDSIKGSASADEGDGSQSGKTTSQPSDSIDETHKGVPRHTIVGVVRTSSKVKPLTLSDCEAFQLTSLLGRATLQRSGAAARMPRVGDLFFARASWRVANAAQYNRMDRDAVAFRYALTTPRASLDTWRLPDSMPRWASPFWLRVVSVSEVNDWFWAAELERIVPEAR